MCTIFFCLKFTSFLTAATPTILPFECTEKGAYVHYVRARVFPGRLREMEQSPAYAHLNGMGRTRVQLPER